MRTSFLRWEIQETLVCQGNKDRKMWAVVWMFVGHEKYLLRLKSSILVTVDDCYFQSIMRYTLLSKRKMANDLPSRHLLF